MNPREKTLLFAVAGLAGLLLVVFGLRFFLLKPVRVIDKQIADLRGKLEKIKAERRAYFVAEDLVKEFTRHSFSDEVDQASAKSGEMLTQQILQSGLKESDFTRLPVGPTRLRPRGANEIGWGVQGDGPLRSVVNLLFLLQESPHLHRLENLAVSPGDAPGQVKVRFRYLTLVIDPAPVVPPTNLVARIALDSPERRVLDAIVSRDILRPYIKRPPPPPGPGPSSPATPGAAPGPENFRIVDLSEWQGQTEVAVLDKTSQKVARYRVGDPFLGGVIVMVDYRALPAPDKPGLMSNSRVIVKIGSEYWAVERGRTLAEKYKLAPEQLPENLSRL